MYQTLFHIPAEIAGWPMFGFGLLLALWAFISACMMAWLVWRQGWNADTYSHLPMLLLLGAAIYWVLPAISDPQGLPIRGYGTMMLAAVLAGAALAVRRARPLGIDSDTVFAMIFWMVVPGIIGARAFYVIEYWPEYARAYTEPGGGLLPFLGGLINLTRGGLVVYGSFFGGVLGLLVFLRKHRLPLLPVLDLFAPSMALGVAIGRIGCLLNGCCFGAICHCGWAITFPAGTPPDYTPPYRAQIERGQFYGLTISGHPKAEPRVLAVAAGSPAEQAGLKPGVLIVNLNGYALSSAADAYWVFYEAFNQGLPLRIQTDCQPLITVPAVTPPPRSLPVHPTQLYSVIDGLAICLILLCYAPRRRRDGELFALLITIYPVTRFIIEGLRTDEAAVWVTGMSIAQNVSILVLLCAAGLWFFLLRRPAEPLWRLDPL